MEELAEGLWDSEKYEMEVEMYNDGSGTAPWWSIDMLKLYFMTGYDEKIWSCYGGPDQGDAGDVWIKPYKTTILRYVQGDTRKSLTQFPLPRFLANVRVTNMNFM